MALINGRPDSKSAQYIYASGQGGVIDYRKSAWDMGNSDEGIKANLKHVNGTYRGEERLTWCEFLTVVTHTNAAIKAYTPVQSMRYGLGAVPLIEATGSTSNSRVSVSTKLYNVTQSAWCTEYWQASLGEGVGYFFGTASNTEIGDVILVTTLANTPVSGNFTMQDVIGDPANILATPQLANGWLGGWIPVIPDGSSRLPATKKYVGDSTVSYITTTDYGVNWSVANVTLNLITNDKASSAVGLVAVMPYTAFAGQTVASSQKPVLNADNGLLPVTVTNSYLQSQGVLLNESVSGIIGTGSDFRTYKPLDYVMSSSGNVSDINTSMEILPDGASELQCWMISDNQEVKLMYFDGTNYTESAISIGYTKNQARAGSQVAGIDL